MFRRAHETAARRRLPNGTLNSLMQSSAPRRYLRGDRQALASLPGPVPHDEDAKPAARALGVVREPDP